MPVPVEIIKMKENSTNREYVLEQVKINGKLLEFADVSLQDDEEIVTEAVNNNPEALEFASNRLKGNREIVYNLRLPLTFQQGEKMLVSSKDNEIYIKKKKAYTKRLKY